jgi:hypothetical protein
MSKPRIAEKIAHDHDEDQTLVGLKDHARFIKHIEPHYNPELFSPGAPRMVAEWCMAHWKTHHKPIRNLENRLTQYCIETKPDEDDKRLLSLQQTIGRLESLSDRQQRTTDELLVHAQRFLDRDYARAIGISETNRDGKLDKCMDAIAKKKRIILGHEEPLFGHRVVPDVTHWIEPFWLAFDELVLIDGPQHMGKSTLVADWAARFSVGWTSLFGGKGKRLKPGGVLWLTREENPGSVIVPRFAASGGDLKRLVMAPRSDIFFPNDLELVKHWIIKYRIGMAVIDPIMSFVGDPKFNPNSYPDVCRFLCPLLDFCRAAHICMILIRHFKKEKDTGGNRGLGSVAWSGVPRIQHVINQKDVGNGKPVTLACYKTIGKRPDVSRISYIVEAEVYLPNPDDPGTNKKYDTWKTRWQGTSEASADEVTGWGKRERGRPGEKFDEVKRVIRELLARGPMESEALWKAVKQATRCGKTLYRKARKAVGAKWHKNGYGAGAEVLWSLPRKRKKRET